MVHNIILISSIISPRINYYARDRPIDVFGIIGYWIPNPQTAFDDNIDNNYCYCLFSFDGNRLWLAPLMIIQYSLVWSHAPNPHFVFRSVTQRYKVPLIDCQSWSMGEYKNTRILCSGCGRQTRFISLPSAAFDSDKHTKAHLIRRQFASRIMLI